MTQRFSTFSWLLALFCLPSALWPLALLVSPKFSDQAHLTTTQINLFSTAFWIYPAVLLTIVGILYKLHCRQKHLANGLLFVSFIGFYGFLYYIINQIQ